jgi:putative membrane protein
VQIIASGTLLAVGLAAPLLAWFHWGSVEVAMRNDQPLPSFRMTLLVSAALAIVAFSLLIGAAVGL